MVRVNPATKRAICAYIGLSVVLVNGVITVRIVMHVRRMTTRTSTTGSSTRTSRLVRNHRDRKERVRAVGSVSRGRTADRASTETRVSTNMTTRQPLQRRRMSVDVSDPVDLRPTRRRAPRRPPLPRAPRRAPRLPVLDGYLGGCWRRVLCLGFGHTLPPTVGGT